MRGYVLRKVAMVLLGLGAVIGFGSAFHHRMHDRHEGFERHVAEVCAEAALRTTAKTPAGGKE